MANQLSLLMSQLGYQFKNIDLLQLALTHHSFGPLNNERLEFLGDSALNLVISQELYNLKPHLDEGDLSRIRASFVCGETLIEIALTLAPIQKCITFGQSALGSGGSDFKTVLADVLEAILGAVYIDGGFFACRDLIKRLYRERLLDIPDAQSLKDAKTLLQEYVQGQGVDLPIYTLVATQGKPHQQIFRVSCKLSSHAIEMMAECSSKRRAEQKAARLVLEKLY